jgi:hypothetical protein
MNEAEFSSYNPDRKSSTGPKKPYIPKEFEFPSFLLEPIKLGDKSKIYFKVVTNSKEETILMIDPLVKTALDAIEKGRSSFDKEILLPALTRYLKEKLPAGARGAIKKAAQGAKITSNGFIALDLVLSKTPSADNSVSNDVISIAPKGIQFLKAIKADPSKAAGLENELEFLIWLYRNKDRENTPKQFSLDTGNSIQLASRVTNKLASSNTINVEKLMPAASDDVWYIKNPFWDNYSDINTKLYESLSDIIKEELLNEVSYGKFKKDVKFRTKSEQLHKAIREVKRKLTEIDRIVEYTSRMKQELSEGEEGIRYWKATQKNVANISEMVNQLNNKIKNLNQ